MTKKPICELDVWYNPHDDVSEKGLFHLLGLAEATGITRVRCAIPHDDCHTIYSYYPAKFIPNAQSSSHYGPTAINYFLNGLLEESVKREEKNANRREKRALRRVR